MQVFILFIIRFERCISLVCCCNRLLFVDRWNCSRGEIDTANFVTSSLHYYTVTMRQTRLSSALGKIIFKICLTFSTRCFNVELGFLRKNVPLISRFQSLFALGGSKEIASWIRWIRRTSFTNELTSKNNEKWAKKLGVKRVKMLIIKYSNGYSLCYFRFQFDLKMLKRNLIQCLCYCFQLAFAHTRVWFLFFFFAKWKFHSKLVLFSILYCLKVIFR